MLKGTKNSLRLFPFFFFFFNWLFIVALTARSYCDCHLMGKEKLKSSDFTAICWATSEVVHHFVNNNGFRSYTFVVEYGDHPDICLCK